MTDLSLAPWESVAQLVLTPLIPGSALFTVDMCLLLPVRLYVH